MLLQRRRNKCDSGLCATKTRKLTSTLVAPRGNPRKGAGWWWRGGGGEKSRAGMYPLLLFHVFQPRPLSPHPRNRECERGGGTWVIAGGGKHDPGHSQQHFAVSLSAKSRRGRHSQKKPAFTLTSRPLRSVLSRPLWMLNPTVCPLYPGASADYSSPPCCVSVCIGRMGSEQQIPRPCPVSSPLCVPAARSDTCRPSRSLHGPD